MLVLLWRAISSPFYRIVRDARKSNTWNSPLSSAETPLPMFEWNVEKPKINVPNTLDSLSVREVSFIPHILISPSQKHRKETRVWWCGMEEAFSLGLNMMKSFTFARKYPDISENHFHLAEWRTFLFSTFRQSHSFLSNLFLFRKTGKRSRSPFLICTDREWEGNMHTSIYTLYFFSRSLRPVPMFVLKWIPSVPCPKVGSRKGE